MGKYLFGVNYYFHPRDHTIDRSTHRKAIVLLKMYQNNPHKLQQSLINAIYLFTISKLNVRSLNKYFRVMSLVDRRIFGIFLDILSV